LIRNAESAEEVGALVKRLESIRFAELHSAVLHLIPARPSRIVDIGSGSGRDAAAFAEMGHSVLAIEPATQLRLKAATLHPSPRIEWLDDRLPALAQVVKRGETFDLAMLTAVWMFLDPEQRRHAMPVVASLIRKGGLAILTLRDGPVPPGKNIFEVAADETVQLAEEHGLALVLDVRRQPSLSGNAQVTWTSLVFSR
jgi:SAM-dependent methyltransferase